MSDAFDPSSPDPLTLVLRAVFVPDGQEPPLELATESHPLRLRATYDRQTRTLICEGDGADIVPDLEAEWHPDAPSPDTPSPDGDAGNEPDGE